MADKRRVREQHRDRGQHGRPPEPAGEAERADQQTGEDRDVAARDRDDVIGPRFLQAALHVVVQARAIADDDRRDNRARLRAPAADARGDRAAGERARARHCFREPPTARQHLHLRTALRGPDQPGASPRELALVVGYAGVEIARRPAERDRQTHAPPRAPTVEAIGCQRPDDGDGDAARRSAKAFALHPVPTHQTRRTYLTYETIDGDAERRAGGARRSVAVQNPFHDRERLVVFWQPPPFGGGLHPLGVRDLHKRAPQRWPPRALPGLRRKHGAAGEEAGDDHSGEDRGPADPPSPDGQGAAEDQKGGGEEAREIRDEETGGSARQEADGRNRCNSTHAPRRCKDVTATSPQMTRWIQR